MTQVLIRKQSLRNFGIILSLLVVLGWLGWRSGRSGINHPTGTAFFAGSEKKQSPDEPWQEKLGTQYGFKILNKWNIGKNGIGLDLLFPTHTAKDVIKKFALDVFNRFKDRDVILINVFDLEEVWKNRDDIRMPEKKYWQHFPAQITKNLPGFAGQAIHWNSYDQITREVIE